MVALCERTHGSAVSPTGSRGRRPCTRTRSISGSTACSARSTAWDGSAPPARSSPSAGTNGKGSCVALTARILREAGYRVGTFTSPHLLRYNERIAIDGVEVSDEALIAAFERIDAARGEDTLTFFEFNAAGRVAGACETLSPTRSCSKSAWAGGSTR